MDITFKTKEHPEPKTVSWDLPFAEEGSDKTAEDVLAELVAKFGAESVVANAQANYVIGAQALGRRHILKSQEELNEIFKNYDPNTRSPISKKTPFERAMAALAGMSEEEKAQFLATIGG